MSPRARWIVLAFALVGLGFAGASTYVHYKILTDPAYISPCDISATLNCTQAYLSRYGTLFGVPVAIGGLLWFALVALIAALSAPAAPRTMSAAGSYILALSIPGLITIAYLGYASAFVLHVGCVLCMGSYVAVTGIFLTAVVDAARATSREGMSPGSDLQAALAGRRKAASWTYITVAILLILLFPREMRVADAGPAPTGDFAQTFETAWLQQPRVNLGAAGGGAKVVVVKFNDWMCPACKLQHQAYQSTLEKLTAANPGAIKLVIKDWLWNAQCNPYVQQTFQGHEASCAAAVAVRIARSHDQGEKFGDWLFDKQQELIGYSQAGQLSKAVDMIKAHLKEVVGVVDFDGLYPKLIEEIKRDEADGSALNVFSTPTYFVNGIRTTSPRSGTDPGGANLPPTSLELGIKIELGQGRGGGR